MVALTPENQIVGCYVLVALDLYLAGKRIRAAQSSDTVVDEDYRGQGLLSKIATKGNELVAEKGFEIIFGCPNKVAMPANIWYIDVSPLCFLKRFELNVDFRTEFDYLGLPKVLAQACGLLLKTLQNWRFLLYFGWLMITQPGMRISKSDCVPQDYDRFWRWASSQRLLSVWKDSQYLSWRYGAHPSNSHTYFCAYVKQNLVGVVVLEESKKGAYIAELMLAQNRIRMAKALVVAAILQAIKRSYGRVTFIGHDNGFFDAVFDGIMVRNPGREFAMVLRQFGSDEAVKRCAFNPESWCITTGDLDLNY